MREHEADFVTSPRPVEIINGTDSSRSRGHVKDGNSNAMTTVEIMPVKAHSDIKSAIRRQKRTETLDYIWQALPISRTTRPLYRAVLRGSLQTANVQYSITNANGHALKPLELTIRDEPSVSGSVRNNTNIVQQLGGVGLRVAGVAINDIKNQDTSGRVSPRVKQGQGPPLYVSRHMKSTFLLDQRSSTNGIRNRKDDDVDETDEQMMIPIKNVNAPVPQNSANGFLSPKNGSSHKPQRFTPFIGERSISLSPVNQHPGNVSPESNKNSAAIKSDANDNVNKCSDKTLPNLTTKSTLGKNSLESGAPIKLGPDVDKTPKVEWEVQSSPNLPPTDLQDSAGSHVTLASKQDSAARELSCIQLADSILGAVNGDLSQVYSLCKSKLRYSDFIEQSQPHRLGDSLGYRLNIPKFEDQTDPTTETTKPQTENPPRASTASTVPKEATPRLPMIKPPQRSFVYQRALSHLNASNKNARAGESGREADKSIQTSETTLVSEKSVRPILKTFKTDLEEPGSGDREDNNNTTSRSVLNKNRVTITANNNNNNNNSNNIGNNRLVRFNTCHEVREFTPSEPIRQQ